MSVMSMPGFSATASLYKAGNRYRMGYNANRTTHENSVLATLAIGGGSGPSTGCVGGCAAACAASCIFDCTPPRGTPWSGGCHTCVDDCMDRCARNCLSDGGGGGYIA
jgi:hypothetical protein